MTTTGKTGTAKDPIFIQDHGAPALWADLVTELEEDGGVVRISFAAVSINGDGQRKATIGVRLRVPKDLAWQLCRDLRKLEHG